MPIRFIVMVSPLANSDDPEWYRFIWGKPYTGPELPPPDHCWVLLTIPDDVTDDELTKFAGYLFRRPGDLASWQQGEEDGRAPKKWLRQCNRHYQDVPWRFDNPEGWREQMNLLVKLLRERNIQLER